MFCIIVVYENLSAPLSAKEALKNIPQRLLSENQLWRNARASFLFLCQAPMLMHIFLLRGKPPANMALRFVHIQNLSGLCCKRRIHLLKAFCNVLMYRAFTDTESLCCLSHRGIIVDDIVSNADGALFDIILQRNTPLRYLFSIV